MNGVICIEADASTPPMVKSHVFCFDKIAISKNSVTVNRTSTNWRKQAIQRVLSQIIAQALLDIWMGF